MVKAKVREKYQGLSRQEVLDKAHALGANYHKYSSSCSQCTVAALHDILGFDDVLVKASTSLAGGTAIQMLGACGALGGGIIVLDYYFGRPLNNISDKELIQANIDRLFAAYEVTMSLVNKFVDEYGTFICAQMHRQFFGRIYCGADPEESRKFEEAGNVKKCDAVVGKATRWVMEILLDKGVIEL